MAKVAFLFPGQGSQYVGMGFDLYERYPLVRELFEHFNEWIAPDLQKVTFEGPDEILRRTLYTQPAVLAVSIAALSLFREESSIQPAFAAGHSLGEFTALYSAGVIDLETTAKLVKKRAELMESAPPGAMAAVIGLPETHVEKAVLHIRSQNLGIISVANYNTAEQIVVSGEKKAVEALCSYVSSELNATKTALLPVGGAFHSAMMEESSESFREYLKGFSFNDADFPVITNVDAQITVKASEFKDKLADQIRYPVRWIDTIRMMRQEGVDSFIEIGPGRVLAGMIKKIHREIPVYNIFDHISLEKTSEQLKERIHI